MQTEDAQQPYVDGPESEQLADPAGRSGTHPAETRPEPVDEIPVMKPVAFEQANTLLAPPEGWTPEECTPLPVHSDGATCISRWRPTEEQRQAISEGADIWLWVVSGRTQPPVALATESPFAASPEEPPPACADDEGGEQ